MRRILKGLFLRRPEYYTACNLQGEDSHSTETPKIGSEMVPHVSPSSSIGLNGGYDFLDFFTGQELEKLSRGNSWDMTHAEVKNGQHKKNSKFPAKLADEIP